MTQTVTTANMKIPNTRTRRAAVNDYASPTVTLTFDLLTPKSNQHTYEPK